MHTRRIALLSPLAALLFCACGKDALPPPAPAVDPIASPTSLGAITVTGAAQYGAKIAITGASAVNPAQVVADPFTARFRAVVTLTHNARNTLAFTATDGAGRTSAPTTVNVDQSDSYAVSLQNLLVNGVPCAPGGVPPSCPAASGDTIDFDLVANSTAAVSEVQYTAFFATAGAAGTLRTQRVLVAPNSPLPYAQHFTFTVPGATLLETVPIEGLSIDGLGNRSTSPALALRVNPLDGLGRTVSLLAVGGLVNAPNDIALDASGNLYVANDGAGNLLKLAAASTFPVIQTGYSGRSNFLTTDGLGNLYVSDNSGRAFRMAPGATAAAYLSFGGGYIIEGLTTDGPTFAKGLVSVGAALAGNTVTVGSKIYEFQPGAVGCAAGNVCMDLNAANRTQALATAVQANSAEANASFDAISGKAVLAAKTAGSAGNSINLATNNALAITLSPTGGKLGEGHDEDLFAGQTGTADTNLYRFPETLTALPAGTGANDGSFAVATQQLGVVVRDLTTASSANLRDLYLYFIDQAATRTLHAYHAVDSTAPAAVFAITPGGGGGDLYDVVLLPNGCLLASDQAAGKIYSLDTRTPTGTAPTVTTVAAGFSRPRGLALSQGNLYVADNGFNAVVRISPLATAACF